MSAYATLADLVAAATQGWTELAQRASTEAALDPALLQAVAAGASTAGWTADQVAVATAGLARLQAALDMAGKHADTYLFPRYRQVMPLDSALVQGGSLPAAVAAIALRRLYGAGVPDEIRRGTAWADEYLMGLAKGTLSLGGADLQVAQPAGQVAARARSGAFDWGAY